MENVLWEDPDVLPLFSFPSDEARANGVMVLDMDKVFLFTDEEERDLFLEFARADQGADGSSEQALIAALVAGVRVFEEMSQLPDVSTGLRKFVLFQTGCNVEMLWQQFRSSECSIFGDWVVVTINQSGWGPDGNETPLGRMHSNCMAVAAEAGGGVRRNRVTDRYEAPTGNEARRYDPATGMAGLREPESDISDLHVNQGRGLFRRRRR